MRVVFSTAVSFKTNESGHLPYEQMSTKVKRYLESQTPNRTTEK